MFLLWAIAFNLHVTLSGETKHVALCFCSSRNKAQKLEVCIHKQNYIHSTWLKSYVRIDAQYCQYNSIISCGIRKKIYSSLQGKTSNFEFEAKSSEDVKKVEYVCHIRETFKFSTLT